MNHLELKVGSHFSGAETAKEFVTRREHNFYKPRCVEHWSLQNIAPFGLLNLKYTVGIVGKIVYLNILCINFIHK
jgi:hypothetical protein